MLERFYELDEFQYLDLDAISAAFELAKVQGSDEKHEAKQRLKLTRVVEGARGRVVIFNADTLRNILKLRSSIDKRETSPIKELLN